MRDWISRDCSSTSPSTWADAVGSVLSVISSSVGLLAGKEIMQKAKERLEEVLDRLVDSRDHLLSKY